VIDFPTIAMNVFLLGVFIAPTLLGYVRGLSPNPLRWHLHVLILAGFAILLTVMTQLRPTSSGGAGLGFVLIFIVFAILPGLISLAWLIGLGIGRLQRRRPGPPLVLLVATLIAPFGVLGKIHLDRMNDVSADRARQAAFEQTTLTGTLGSNTLRIPASPEVRLIFKCQSNGQEKDCHWPLSIAPDPTDKWRYNTPQPLKLVAVTFEQATTGCVDSSQSPPTCKRAENVDRWCANRPDLSETVWCSARAPVHMTFHPRSPNETQKPSYNSEDWQILPTPADADGDVTVQCNQNVYNGPQCRAHLSFAPDAYLEMTFQPDDTAAAWAAVTAALPRARGIWGALQSKP